MGFPFESDVCDVTLAVFFIYFNIPFMEQSHVILS